MGIREITLFFFLKHTHEDAHESECRGSFSRGG